MPTAFRRSMLAVSAEADAVCALLDGGSLDLYTGSQPATADTAVTTQTRLARLTFGAPAFDPAVDGIADATAFTSDPDAAASGDAGWFRALTSDETPVFDGSVDLADADLILDTTTILQHAQVSVTALSYVGTKA